MGRMLVGVDLSYIILNVSNGSFEPNYIFFSFNGCFSDFHSQCHSSFISCYCISSENYDELLLFVSSSVLDATFAS